MRYLIQPLCSIFDFKFVDVFVCIFTSKLYNLEAFEHMSFWNQNCMICITKMLFFHKFLGGRFWSLEKNTPNSRQISLRAISAVFFLAFGENPGGWEGHKMPPPTPAGCGLTTKVAKSTRRYRFLKISTSHNAHVRVGKKPA